MDEKGGRIYKFTLGPGFTSIAGIGRVLAVDWQGDDLRLWAESGNERAEFVVVPTGGDVPENAEFIGTAIGVPYVMHVYRAPR